MALGVWQATITNESGDIQSLAEVTVLLESTGASAALFSDRDGAVPISNPVTADSNGFVRFYAAGSAYRITATLGAFSREWRHVGIGLLGEADTVSGSQISYIRTPAEIAALVTPVDYAYEPGDIRRYGAVSGADSKAAIISAISQASQNGHDVYIPAGTWNCPDFIALKSNVRIFGEGYSSNIVGAAWTGSIYALLYASRDDADAPYTNIIIENIRVTGALNGGSPSHSNQGAAILIAYATTVRLRNVIVDQADDACIRMEGYIAGTVFPLASSDPDVNADLGHLNDFVIDGCRCTGGYMGLEIEGGASGAVLGGYFEGGTTYGIRMPRAQHVRVVGAHIHGLTDQALWMDYVNRSEIIGNTISTDDAGEPCVAIGYNKDVSIAHNTIRGGNVSISDSVMYAATIDAGGSVHIAHNNCDARIQHLYHQKAIVEYNECTFVEFNSTAKGIIRGNKGSLTITAGKQLAEGGADVLVLDNTTAATFLPRVDDGNYGLIGTATGAPTTGTFEAGHVIMARAQTPDLPLGWACTTGGTPGSWEDFGEVRPGNCREFFVANNADNITDRAAVTMTVPNAEVFLVIEALATVHRQPSSSPGTSQIQRAVFSIGRQTGSDVVIDTYIGVGEYTKTSTTAGGATSASAMNLECARTGAESSSSAQAVAVRLDVAGGLRNYNVHVRVLGEFNGTTFVRG